ncbi:OmpA/MotB family protein [Mesoterricola silvestris]|uniref:Chemotaxis protein n=1 Tax=Mesoterricola silvestris TaxID=2927979 RepID=A0AA48GNG7_9BACT|nr:flagellar motor protein MotB [Mesoterricola silvestris]BDU74559.1 chemotaxis protein [Mesoterricola silvestris]
MAKILSRSQRRKDDYEGLWFITFADLMVQLMAFFAVIYSFTSQDQRKVQEVLLALQHELGAKGTGVLPGHTGIAPERAADLEKLLNDLKPVDGPDHGVRMQVVRFRGGLLFGEASSAFDPTFEPMMKRISEIALQYPGYTLVCEGHSAQDEQGRPKGQDALELSSQRALTAVRHLAALGMDPATLAAEAHGDSQLEGNPDTPEGRALQRRVKFRFQKPLER